MYSLLDPDVGDTLVRIDHSPVDFLFYVYHIVQLHRRLRFVFRIRELSLKELRVFVDERERPGHLDAVIGEDGREQKDILLLDRSRVVLNKGCDRLLHDGSEFIHRCCS